MSSVPPRKIWTRTECAALSEAGLLPQESFELVQGELISRMGKKRPHTNTLVLVLGWLVEVFGNRFVNPETPIDVSPADNPTNEPEPDLIVLKRDISHFQSANPRPEDLHLVIEIADSTLDFDLTRKARLYARAGIPEYWVLDVSGRRLIVHRDPEGGAYRSIAAHSETGRVAPLAAPHREFSVSEAFAL